MFVLLLLLPLGCNNSSKDQQAAKGSAKSDSQKQKGSKEPSKANSLRAQRLLDAGKVDEAWDEAQRVMVGAPQDHRALLVAAMVMEQRGKLATALQLADRIDLADRDFGPRAAYVTAKWCFDAGDLLNASTRCERSLAKYPNEADTLSLLAAVYELQGRRFEASKVNQQLVRLGKFNIMTLVLAIDTVKPLDGDAEVAKLAEKRPDDALLRALPALGLIHSHQPELAESQLREIVSQPGMPAVCYLGLGVALIDQEKYESIPEWFANLKVAGAELQPSYWRVLGTYFKHEQRYEEAIYCLTRSAELDPFDYLALGPLSQSLAAIQDDQRAEQAESLFQVNQLTSRNVNYIRDGFRKPEWMLQIAEALEKCGRVIEAVAWREMCEMNNDKNQQKIDALQAQRRQLAATPNAALFAVKTNFSWNTAALKAPSWDQLAALSKETNATTKAPSSQTESEIAKTAQLSFSDRAKELGGDFQYFNGDDPKVVGMQTYQSNGAGAAAIDFDKDGWPDLFALQGGGDPRREQGNGPCALLRNRFAKSFVDVANLAGVTNTRYGQGAAVGDWDQDGFSDLFVLNFGENRLFRNMGDGTFEQVAIASMKRDIKNAPVWSVSGAIADINGDHLPDIVEVNYSSGIDAITHLCLTADREVQVCRPTEFPASRDYLYLNDGMGGFTLTNDEWNLPLDDGRGLGIVVGNLDQNNGNDIYIANDMSANHLLVSYPVQDKKTFTLREEAVRRGCAVDVYGKPQASMGVGCADVDRNGTLDLFMTNFLNENNALYLQSKNGSYEDASRRYKFTDINKTTLGFGTQLVDLDRDGWHDCIIVNGHVEDYTKAGKPYRMRPQLLLQRNGAFVEQPNESLGDFFAVQSLGRSLGVFDFNRDGWIDFFATHLDKPLSIIQNQSSSSGAWLAVDLIGTESERDAIGATLSIQSGDQTWIHQRLTGNGFECTSEGTVWFGLGAVRSIDALEVKWPSGKMERWQNVPVNQRVSIIESSGSIETIGELGMF